MAKAGDAADSVLESLGAAATTKPQEPLHSPKGGTRRGTPRLADGTSPRRPRGGMESQLRGHTPAVLVSGAEAQQPCIKR